MLVAGLAILIRTVNLGGKILSSSGDSINIDPWFAAAAGLLTLIFFAGAKGADLPDRPQL